MDDPITVGSGEGEEDPNCPNSTTWIVDNSGPLFSSVDAGFSVTFAVWKKDGTGLPFTIYASHSWSGASSALLQQPEKNQKDKKITNFGKSLVGAPIRVSINRQKLAANNMVYVFTISDKDIND